MIKKVSHIGIAVKSLSEQIPYYRDILGLEFAGQERVEDQKVTVAFFKVGEIRIELLEGMNEESPVAKYIEKRGQGIHHIAYEVDNCKDSLEYMKKHDIRLIDTEPRAGAEGSQIAFLHPKSSFGVLTELCEEQ